MLTLLSFIFLLFCRVLHKMSKYQYWSLIYILLCYIAQRIADSYQEITTLKQEGDNNSYKYEKLSSYGFDFTDAQFVKFSVKAKTNAVVALMEHDSYTDALLHIKISGWSNTETRIGNTRSDYVKIFKHQSSGLLDPDVFKEIEVSWSNNEIGITAWIDGEWTTFLKYEYSNTNSINYVGVTTGVWSDGYWRIYESNEILQHTTAGNKYLTTAEKNDVTQKQTPSNPVTTAEKSDVTQKQTPSNPSAITTDGTVDNSTLNPVSKQQPTAGDNSLTTTKENGNLWGMQGDSDTPASDSQNTKESTTAEAEEEEIAISFTGIYDDSITAKVDSLSSTIDDVAISTEKYEEPTKENSENSFSPTDGVTISTTRINQESLTAKFESSFRQTDAVMISTTEIYPDAEVNGTFELVSQSNSSCRLVKQMNNVTEEELFNEIKQLKEELHVEKDSTSMSRNSKISAPDPRTSATVIGVGGSIFMGVVFGGVIFVDLPNLKRMFMTMFHNMRQ